MNRSVKDMAAARFRQLCTERGIRPNELAVLSGVTPSTVYSMFYPQLGVKTLLDGGRRRSKSLKITSQRAAPTLTTPEKAGP